jgi:FkbM family methyltransferase
MLIQWEDISKFFYIPVNGVLHVGGHLAEEVDIYQHNMVGDVIWIEADERRANQIRKIVPTSHVVICAVVGDEIGKEVTFHEANNGQSSSILELGTHAEAHPEVQYVSSRTVNMNTIENLNIEKKFNFLNLDIQGAELLALKGMGNLLENVDYIYTEVNEKELYEGCCLISDLDDFLAESCAHRNDSIWMGRCFLCKK